MNTKVGRGQAQEVNATRIPCVSSCDRGPYVTDGRRPVDPWALDALAQWELGALVGEWLVGGSTRQS